MKLDCLLCQRPGYWILMGLWWFMTDEQFREAAASDLLIKSDIEGRVPTGSKRISEFHIEKGYDHFPDRKKRI